MTLRNVKTGTEKSSDDISVLKDWFRWKYVIWLSERYDTDILDTYSRSKMHSLMEEFNSEWTLDGKPVAWYY